MVHKVHLTAGMMAWRCGFCDRSFDNMYSRDLHEIHCTKRKGAKTTSQGRRVGTAY